MRFLYLTSTGTRHSAFLNFLVGEFPPSLIIREAKKNIKISSKLISSWNKEFFETEANYFPEATKNDHQSIFIDPGMINQKKHADLIRRAKPDILLVFGTSILSDEILKIPSKFSLNIHTGITQIFRGVDSTFWAIHDNKPEGIGATIHFIDNTIDAGEIVVQKRTVFGSKESEHSIFLKTCELGFELMAQGIRKILQKKIIPQKLLTKGKLYQVNNFSEVALSKVLNNRESVIRKYLKNKKERDSRFPLISD